MFSPDVWEVPRLIVVLLQKWWSGVDADPRDHGCSLQALRPLQFSKLVGRATVRDTRNVSRTRASCCS